MNVVIGDLVRPALQYQYSHCGRVNEAEVMDLIIRDDLPVIRIQWIRAFGGFADSDSSRAQPGNFIAYDSIALATPAMFESIPTQLGKGTIFNHTICGGFG